MEKKRILLVEDDPNFCTLLRDFFAQTDDLTVCAQAHDGLTALELIHSLSPDLVLLDLILPGMDGLAVLRRLSAEPVRPKVIVLSGVTAEPYIRMALGLGASYYMIKPLSLPELALRIHALFPLPDTCPAAGAEAWYLLRLGARKEDTGFDFALFAAELLRSTAGKVQMKRLYLETAQHFATSAACVEKNLRTFIRHLHRSQRGSNRYTLSFDPTSSPPSNGAFLSWLIAQSHQAEPSA